MVKGIGQGAENFFLKNDYSGGNFFIPKNGNDDSMRTAMQGDSQAGGSQIISSSRRPHEIDGVQNSSASHESGKNNQNANFLQSRENELQEIDLENFEDDM